METEAEEEEEQGLQAGLGDFGFGVSKSKEDDEAVGHNSDPFLSLPYLSYIIWRVYIFIVLCYIGCVTHTQRRLR